MFCASLLLMSAAVSWLLAAFFLQGGGARDFVLQPLDATFTFKQLSRYGKAGVPPHWLEDSTGQH